MAPLDDGPLAVGDAVEVINMGESMNGVVGTLVKMVGKGRWALRVEGDERSKVINVENLQKCDAAKSEKQGLGPASYCIVGTWDDWDPNPMSWNAELECFEHLVTVGEQGCENFKILLNGDWDRCVYPDRKDANPHVAHGLKGPDDGGLDEEWTIGYHPKDEVTVGSRCKIRLFVAPDGQPKRVSWEVNNEKAKPEVKQEVKPEVKQPVKWAKPDTTPEVRQEEPLPVKGNSPQPDAPYTPEHLVPAAAAPQAALRGGQLVVDSAQVLRDEQILEREREARERLARRLEAAKELLAIRDDGSDLVLLKEAANREAQDRIQQVEENRERYRRSMEDNHNTTLFDYVQGQAEPGAGEDGWDQDDELRKAGWNASVRCDGIPAGVRAEALVADGSLSRRKARQYVMRQYPEKFQH